MPRHPGMLHPFWTLRIVYAWWLLAGAMITAGAVVGWEPSASLDDLPDPLQLLIGLVLVAGSGACLVGTARWRTVTMQWKVERSGLWLGAGAWLGYGLAAAFGSLPTAMVVGTSATWTVLALTRLAVLARRDRATVDALEGGA